MASARDRARQHRRRLRRQGLYVDIANFRNLTCNHNNFYRSAEDAAAWHAEYPDGRLLPVAEAFDVLRRADVQVFLEEQPSA